MDYTAEELEEMMMDGTMATECPEGCEVEPDGRCPHGYNSILIEMGLIQYCKGIGFNGRYPEVLTIKQEVRNDKI